MAIPHPKTVRASLTSPEQIHRSFHWWFFQLPELPEMSVAANVFAFIDYLWKYWSPGLDDPAHLRRIKDMLSVPGVLTASLGYYRAMFQPPDPACLELWALMEQRITVPTLSICGGDDIRGEVLEAQRVNFAGEYSYAILPECGHFLHRERPAEVTRLVLDWLAKDN
ncbi:MAG: alpha/beta hydrolase, partial [Blastocatellia bacterium]|nr:alpha/beta hydrolase [Blastocatellia bacterium]